MHSMAVQQVHTGVELYDFYHLRNKKKHLKFVLNQQLPITVFTCKYKRKNEIFIYEDVS